MHGVAVSVDFPDADTRHAPFGIVVQPQFYRGDLRVPLQKNWGKRRPHERRVHWRTHFSGKCTDALHLMLILSTHSVFLDCPFTKKIR